MLTAKNGNSLGDDSRSSAPEDEFAVSDKPLKTDKKKEAEIRSTGRRNPKIKVSLSVDGFPSLRWPLLSQACTTSRRSTVTARLCVQSVPVLNLSAHAQIRQPRSVSSKTTATLALLQTFRRRRRGLLATPGLRYHSLSREACRQLLGRRASQVGTVHSSLLIWRLSPT